MSLRHDLHHLFPADLDDDVVHEIGQLFTVAQSDGTPDELASETVVVAFMAQILQLQSGSLRAARRGNPLHRGLVSRTAKVVVMSGLAVVSTSAVAAAAGILPRPIQSALDRVAEYAGWDFSASDAPTDTTRDHPEPTTITVTDPDAVVNSAVPPAIAIDRDNAVKALCGRWASSVRSGVELESDATHILVAMAERAGYAVERLCSPYAASSPDISSTAEATTTPQTVPLSMFPAAASSADVSTVGADPSPTTDETASNTTLPPQAHGNGPPSDKPSPPGQASDGDTSGDANGHGDANASANGGNPNGNSGNPNGNSGNPNGNSGNPNSGNANADAENASGNANANANGNGSTNAGVNGENANGNANANANANGNANTNTNTNTNGNSGGGNGNG